MTTPTGCPRRPSWSDHRDAGDRRPGQPPRPLRRRAAAAVRGQPAAAPGLQHRHRRPDGVTGWLVPDISYSTRKGLEIAAPYHWQIGPNRDLTVTPHVYTGVLPAIEAKYRELNRIGAFQLGGFLTYGTIESADPDATDRERGTRASRLFRRQRQVPARPAVEHHRPRSGWPPTRPSPGATTSPATTGCATSSMPSGSAPTATSRSPAGPSRACASTTSKSRSRSLLPAIDARFRLADPVLGGKVELQAQQPVDHPHRGPGHAARLRQRALGPAPADAAGARS